MADTDKTPAMLLDELAVLAPHRLRRLLLRSPPRMGGRLRQHFPLTAEDELPLANAALSRVAPHGGRPEAGG